MKLGMGNVGYKKNLTGDWLDRV